MRLDDDQEIDPGAIKKVIQTICAIANNGPSRSGIVLLGVADSEADKNRVEELYGISARPVGRKFVVGVRREADALGESVEDYFGRIRTAIDNSDLSDPLKAAVLASTTFNDYFGMGIIVINVPTQSVVSTVGEQAFARRGDTTIEVTGKALIDVASRFNASALSGTLAARGRSEVSLSPSRPKLSKGWTHRSLAPTHSRISWPLAGGSCSSGDGRGADRRLGLARYSDSRDPWSG